MNVIPPLAINGAGTFTRASVGSYFDSDGVLRIAAVDIPRFSFDPGNLASGATLLVEAAATNVILYSEQFNNAAWGPDSVSVTANQIAGPDGNVTADKVTATAGSGTHDINQGFTGTAVEYTVSLFAKAGTASWLGLSVTSGASVSGAFFDLANGVVGTVAIGGVATIGALGNGWYLCRLVRTLVAGTNYMIVEPHTADAQVVNYAAAGTESIYVIGADVKIGTSSYIPTTSVAVTRAADVNTKAMVTNVPEAAPAAYAGGTTYSEGQQVSTGTVGGVLTVYQSLQASNVGHTPASSPTWWKNIGTTYSTYSAGVTYASGDTVIDVTNHLEYQSLVAGNIGHALTDATKWYLNGPTNAWKMFDTLRNTATVGVSPVAFALVPGVRIDAVALMGMVATDAAISMANAGAAVYASARDLNTREVMNAYDYCFAPFTTQPSLSLFDLPPYSSGALTVTLTNSGGSAECGACVIGSQVYIGAVLAEPESDVLNFSQVTRDTDGTATLVPERNLPRTVQQILLPKNYVTRARALRDALNGSPAVWAVGIDSADQYDEALLILGLYKRFTINLKHPQHAIISLELEEI